MLNRLDDLLINPRNSDAIHHLGGRRMPQKKTEQFTAESLAKAADGLMAVANQLKAVSEGMEQRNIETLDLAFALNFREGSRRVAVFVGAAHQKLAEESIELG